MLLVPTALLAAPPDRPAAGTEVDETRMVAQRAQAPQDCLALTWPGVTLLLDRQELARKAAAPPAQWTTEAERLALIDSKRAAGLLSAAAPAKARGGCAQIGEALDGEASAYVLAALERGATTVFVDRSKAPLAAVAIRYLGTRCGPLCGRGDIMVSVPGQARPFLVQNWWAS